MLSNIKNQKSNKFPSIATCSSDNTVKIFDIKNGAHLGSLRHNGPVWQVSWAYPKFGNILASCSYDRKVIIWKEISGEFTKWFEYNHDSSVNSVSWAPAEMGLSVACASSDGSISILTCNIENNSWEAKKIPNAHIIGCNSVSWAPSTLLDSKNNGIAEKNSAIVKRLVSGGCDNTVKIWKEDGDRYIEETRLEVHSDWVRDVAWGSYHTKCIASKIKINNIFFSTNWLTENTNSKLLTRSPSYYLD